MKKFFRDLSWAQVFAGALAAVTSFFLSARIGIAGSAIGVAVGSIVSAVASQIYKNVLDASTHKIQETVISSDGQTEVLEYGDSGDDKTRYIQSSERSAASHTEEAADKTSVLPALSTDGTKVLPTVDQPQKQYSSHNRARTAKSTATLGSVTAGGSHSNQSVHVSKSARQKKQMVILVSVVSALVAVLLSAVVINVITKGEGTDHVVRNIVSPTPTVQTPSQPSSVPQNTLPSESPSRTSESKSPQQEQSQQTQSPSTTPTPSSSATQSSQPSESSTPTNKPTESPTPSASATQSPPKQEETSGDQKKESSAESLDK